MSKPLHVTLERIGNLADDIETARTMTLSRQSQLTNSVLIDIRNELRAIFIEGAGYDPWQDAEDIIRRQHVTKTVG